MNLNINQIKNKISDLKSVRSINPHKHWSFILGFMFFAMFLFIFYGLFIYYKIHTGTLFKEQDISSVSPVTVKTKLLKEINESFENKNLRQKSLLENPVLYPDPGIIK